MANIASPVALVSYNPVSDSAVIVYEIPVAVNKVSLLARTIGTSDNAKVTVNKSGLLDAVNVLEKAGVVNFLATQAGATATGLIVSGSGFAVTALAAAGTTKDDATVNAKDFIIVGTATANQGVRLSAITPLTTKRVINNTAAAIKVYPASGDYIGTASVDVALTLAAGDSCILWAKPDAVTNTTTGKWQILQS
jgi:hypothetical protein